MGSNSSVTRGGRFCVSERTTQCGEAGEGGAISTSEDFELPEGDWELSLGAFTARNAEDLLLRERTTGAVRVMLVDRGTATYPLLSSRGRSMRLATSSGRARTSRSTTWARTTTARSSASA